MLENLIKQHLIDLRAKDQERLEKERLSNEQKRKVVEFALNALKDYVGLNEENQSLKVKEPIDIPEGFEISFNVSYKDSRAVRVRSKQVLKLDKELGNYYLSDSLSGVMIEDGFADCPSKAKEMLAVQLAKYYHTSIKIKEGF